MHEKYKTHPWLKDPVPHICIQPENSAHDALIVISQIVGIFSSETKILTQSTEMEKSFHFHYSFQMFRVCFRFLNVTLKREETAKQILTCTKLCINIPGDQKNTCSSQKFAIPHNCNGSGRQRYLKGRVYSVIEISISHLLNKILSAMFIRSIH